MAVVDLLRGYPAREFVWREVRRFRLAVVDTNAPVLGFWQRMGFAPTGESRPYRYDLLESTTRLYEKDLSR